MAVQHRSLTEQLARRALATFLVLNLAIVVVGLLSRWYLDRSIHRVTVSGLTKRSSRVENILLVGSTDRCGLKQQNAAFGLCSDGVTGVNSDVVMIMHLDPGTHQASLLSIPRDTFVPNARSTGGYKIDAALYEGPSQLVHAIEEDFAIPINHFVELNFDGFQGVVNALGGISMYFPEPVHDDLSGLDVRTPGCKHLDGFTALEVARSRHLRYRPPSVTSSDPEAWPQDPQSDLSRIRRNHEFLRVVATSLSKRDLANPLSDHTLLSALLPQVTVDRSFTLPDMVDLLTAFQNVDPNRIPQLTLPVTVDSSSSFVFRGTDYGNVALPVRPDDQYVIDAFLGNWYGLETMHTAPLPKPGTISVAVQNGTGRPDQATTVAASLRALGFRAGTIADTTPSGTVSETIVSYSDPASRPAAERVARSLNGVVTLAEEPRTAGASITVTTGTDLTIADATPASTTTTTTGHDRTPPTTTSNAALTSPELTAPNAPVDHLAAFDPRSCTAHGGPGA